MSNSQTTGLSAPLSPRSLHSATDEYELDRTKGKSSSHGSRTAPTSPASALRRSGQPFGGNWSNTGPSIRDSQLMEKAQALPIAPEQCQTRCTMQDEAPRFVQIEQDGPPSNANPPPKNVLWPRIRFILKEPLAEFFGTMIMILFGNGVDAQVTLFRGNNGDYQSINWVWGIGVLFGIYVAGGISGAHLNPAVTLMNCIFRKFPLKKWPIYAAAQVLGCMTGALIIYGTYNEAIDNYEGGARTVPPAVNATAGIFATYPQSYLNTEGAFFSELVASAVLMFSLFAIGDQKNNPPGILGPLIILFLIFGLGAALGVQTGYAMNPARDFGPRLATYIVGYGNDVWSAGNHYFWIPIIAPFIGTFIGALLYDLFLYTGESWINEPWFGSKKYYLKYFSPRFSKMGRQSQKGAGMADSPKIEEGQISPESKLGDSWGLTKSFDNPAVLHQSHENLLGSKSN